MNSKPLDSQSHSRPCSRVPLARSTSEVKAVYLSPLLLLTLWEGLFCLPRSCRANPVGLPRALHRGAGAARLSRLSVAVEGCRPHGAPGLWYLNTETLRERGWMDPLAPSPSEGAQTPCWVWRSSGLCPKRAPGSNPCPSPSPGDWGCLSLHQQVLNMSRAAARIHGSALKGLVDLFLL